jgi:hypothetical protein
MRRREFIKLLGVTTTTWPLTARAQRGQMKSIAILLHSVLSGAGDIGLDDWS